MRGPKIARPALLTSRSIGPIFFKPSSVFFQSDKSKAMISMDGTSCFSETAKNVAQLKLLSFVKLLPNRIFFAVYGDIPSKSRFLATATT